MDYASKRYANGKYLCSTEAATGSVLCKKVFLKISQNLQKTHVQSLFFNKFSG